MSAAATQKFCQRKAPIPPGSDVFIRRPNHVSEETTLIHYPKDVRGQILLKNMPMRMAVKADGETVQKPPAKDVHGRLKSDITENKEKIYERSYY